MQTYRPPLTVREHPGGVRLALGWLTYGDGGTLQEAADDLLERVLVLARVVRRWGTSVSPEMVPDPEALKYLCELDELAAAGGDVRGRLFAA